MTREKTKHYRMVSFEDLLLSALFSWVVKKILDFLWSRGKVRIAGESHMRDYFFRVLTTIYILYANGISVFFVFDSNPKTSNPIAQRTLRDILIIHKRYHRYVGCEPCNLCHKIRDYEASLRKYVSEQDLYPPFNPIDSWKSRRI